MRELADLRESFYGELDDALSQMCDNADVARWLNDARARTHWYQPKTAPITWLQYDRLVALPADLVTFDRLVVPSGTVESAFRVWNGSICFTDPDGACSTGSGTVYYGAVPPTITGSAPSVQPEILDQALVSWALSRFYRRLASSRSDYRRYSTIAQGNAADIGQLLSEGDRHHADFMEAVDGWQMPAPASYFAG